MKIQISFDTNNLAEIIEQAKTIEPYFDQFSIGTYPLYTEGISILKTLKNEFPKKLILVKCRIADYAQEQTNLFASYGVNAISVLPGISRTMLHAITIAAHDKGMRVVLEIFDTTFMNQSILEAKQLGTDAILFHYFQDKSHQQSLSEQWDFLKDNINLPIFLETTFTKEIIDALPILHPQGIILTESFMKNKNAIDDVKYIHQLFHNN